jgi:hypothetical protein
MIEANGDAKATVLPIGFPTSYDQPYLAIPAITHRAGSRQSNPEPHTYIGHTTFAMILAMGMYSRICTLPGTRTNPRMYTGGREALEKGGVR